MKVISIVAILGLVTAGSAYEPECPGNNIEGPTVLPNPEDCTSYFTCRNGYPIMVPCPNGQHFNPKKLKCTDPEEAKCVVTTTTEKPTTTTSTTTQKPTTTTTTTTTTTPKPTPSYPVKCPAPNGSGDIVLLPNPKDCTTYFRCREGLPIIISCPNGLHFDPHNLNCTYPAEAGCQVTTTTTPTPVEPVTCPPDNKSAKLPKPDDCSSYYECTKGLPNLVSCPSGLHFNPVELECDFPEDAGCEVFPTSSTIASNTTTTLEPTTTTLEPYTTTPKPTTTTPKPTTTTPEPSTTTPKPTTTTPKPTTTTPEPSTTTPKPTTTTPKPTTTTPEPSTTTPKPTTTTPEPTTTTSKPTSSTAGSTTTTEIPIKCPNGNILIPNPKDCETYYQCSNGYPWLMKCPPNLHFWAEMQRCDYPNNAKCVIS